MQKFFSLLLGTTLSLGAIGLSVATPPTNALALVPLDLSAKGLPVIIDAPAGTTVTKVSDDGPEFVRLTAPGYELTVWPDEYAGSKAVLEARRGLDKEGRTVLVNEPTAYRYKGGDGTSDNMGVLLGGPKQKTCFTIFGVGPSTSTHPFTAAQSDVMFAAAKGARLKTAAPLKK